MPSGEVEQRRLVSRKRRASPPRRRDRSAQSALSREAIIAATVAIMNREGLQKATMRRVAEDLDTGQASLYVYVRNTVELHAAVLDALLGTLKVATSGSWSERILTLLTDYRSLLFTHPGLARSALVVRPSGPHILGLVDRLLALMGEGGIDPQRASWGADLLLLSATATAAEHAEPQEGDADAAVDRAAAMTEMERAVRTANPAVTPHVAAHAEALLAGTPQQRWRWAIAAQLAGIAGSPPPLPSRRRRQ